MRLRQFLSLRCFLPRIAGGGGGQHRQCGAPSRGTTPASGDRGNAGAPPRRPIRWSPSAAGEAGANPAAVKAIPVDRAGHSADGGVRTSASASSRHRSPGSTCAASSTPTPSPRSGSGSAASSFTRRSRSRRLHQQRRRGRGRQVLGLRRDRAGDPDQVGLVAPRRDLRARSLPRLHERQRSDLPTAEITPPSASISARAGRSISSATISIRKACRTRTFRRGSPAAGVHDINGLAAP